MLHYLHYILPFHNSQYLILMTHQAIPNHLTHTSTHMLPPTSNLESPGSQNIYMWRLAQCLGGKNFEGVGWEVNQQWSIHTGIATYDITISLGECIDCGASVSKLCCAVEAGARLSASGTTASVPSSADSAATRSRWWILKAADLRLRSSTDSAAVLRCWHSQRAANLPAHWDSVLDTRSRIWCTHCCANLLCHLGRTP